VAQAYLDQVVVAQEEERAFRVVYGQDVCVLHAMLAWLVRCPLVLVVADLLRRVVEVLYCPIEGIRPTRKSGNAISYG
jgi:hypothetical protein